MCAGISTVTDSVLEVVCHEARRLFRDRLACTKDLHAFDNILSSVMRGDWGADALDNTKGNTHTHTHTHTVSNLLSCIESSFSLCVCVCNGVCPLSCACCRRVLCDVGGV